MEDLTSSLLVFRSRRVGSGHSKIETHLYQSATDANALGEVAHTERAGQDPHRIGDHYELGVAQKSSLVPLR